MSNITQRKPSTTGGLTAEAISKMTPEAMAAMLMAVANNKRQALNEDETLNVQVSQKGAISVYGLGRMPVTLYIGQWERFLEVAEQFRAYLEGQKGNPLVSVKEE